MSSPRSDAWWRRRDRAELIGIASLAGFLFLVSGTPLAISVAVSPDAIERGEVQLTEPCPVRAQTGEGCVTCGMTRGFCSMSRLRLGDAHDYNPGAPWLYLATLGVFSVSGWFLLGVARALWSRRLRPTLAT